MRKIRMVVVAFVFAASSIGGLAPVAQASECEPGDPNCNVGCEVINRIFKDSCQTS